MSKRGVFLCSGCDIGDALDLSELESVADDEGAQCVIQHEQFCSKEGVSLIKKTFADGDVDTALLAACSHRAKQDVFQFDRSKEIVERASLREQVVWSHTANDEDTQMLAEDLIRMGLANLEHMKPITPHSFTINLGVLVVGGGLTGMETAKAVSGLEHSVVLVEKEAKLGGYLADFAYMLPESAPYDKLMPGKIGDLIEDVAKNDNIRILTSTKIIKTDGMPGQFEVTVETAGKTETFKVGAIVQATGSKPYDANKLEHLGYGVSPDVITTVELDKMLQVGAVKKPSDGSVPSRVVFIQCAGSRDQNHLPYCSAECCSNSLRQVTELREKYPDIISSILYKDMRTPGQLEHFYLAMQEQSGAMLAKGEVQSVKSNGGVLGVHMTESLLGDDINVEADIVVLAVGQVPNGADGEAIRLLTDAKHQAENSESSSQRAKAKKTVEELSAHDGTKILNLNYRQGPDLPALKYGFPDSHFICFPYETRRTGIYAAGTLRAPMDSAQAVEDGWGAAMKAVQCIEMAIRGEAVHPRAGDQALPDFFLQRCTQCKRCTEECPFGTLNEDAKGTPELNELRCRRCGICFGACPERIISFEDYAVLGVADSIKAMEVPEEWDEKPRILALMCENDALPALDKAAAKGIQWNPWVRVIPLRCLGSLSIVWIADALSRGIDGVIILGCRFGDDYQCHYVKGSELANKRLENIQETLERLALEPERIKLVEVGHDEWERIPKEFDAFSEELEELEPNPMKGF